MKAKVTGVSAWQGVPVSGTLDIKIPQRYVDSDGNATVSHYSGELRTDGSGPRWVNALNPNEDLWVVVQGPLDPVGSLATFHEIVSYGPESDVRTTFTRRLVSSDLNGLFFDYAQPAPVNPAGFGQEPLTMQAARQVLGFVPTLEQATGSFEAVLADIEQLQAAIGATANSVPYANVASFPASSTATKGALAMDTGGAYSPGGTTWGNPVGYVQTLDTLIAATLDDIGLSRGRIAGDSRQHLGRTYYWDATSAETVSATNPTVLQAAGGGVGRWIMADREWCLNLKWFEYLVVDGDWIPAINAALQIGGVYIPAGLFTVKPTATNFIKFPSGKPRTLSGAGAGSVLKVADGTGNYGTVIGQESTGTYLTDIRLARFRINQNSDNNTGTITVGSVGTQQSAIAFFKYRGVDIDDVTVDLATGVNTITLNGAACERASVRNCHITWARRAGNPQFDNSAIYVNCYDHKVINNTITARSVADGAWGAIESHGAQSVVSGNTITNFEDGINLVTFSGADPETGATSSIVCADNVLNGGAIGVRLWVITGKTMRNVHVTGNVVVLRQGQWPASTPPAGILVSYSTTGTLDGDIDGLLIAGNTIEFDPTEPRTTGIPYASIAGIGVAGNGNASNVRIYGNSVRNAPFWAYVIGRAGKILTNLRMFDNIAHNAGTAVGHSPSAARVPLAFLGLITNARIGRFSVVEDTATPQAPALLFAALTGGSSVTVDSLDITAPNNAALIVPFTPPTGVTFEVAAKLSAANTWTATQTMSKLIVQGLAEPFLAAQSGAATATVNTAAAQITRSVAAGANIVTGPTLRLNDVATSTGGRFNLLADLQWDSVSKFAVTGASHAMGAGIITTGGWARASANLTPGEIAAGAWWESANIAVPGAALGDDVEVAATYFTPLGLLAVGIVSASGQVRVRLKNDTAVAMTPTAGAAWKIAVFRS